MKKYIALFALALAVTLPSQAQYLLTRHEHDMINAMIERAAAQKNNIQATLTVEIPVTKQYLTNPDDAHIDFADSAEYRSRHNVPTYQTTVGCKAYALDNHWLIAGAACLWNGRHNVYINGKNYPTGLVEEDLSKTYLKADGVEITMKDNLFIQAHFTMLPHFLLVRVPQNSKLAAKVKNMPKINILGLIHTNPLTFKKGTFHVNSSRFGWNAARQRTLSAYDTQTNTITIRELFDGIATLSNDPLLYVLNEKIYWIGINNGVMVTYPNAKWDGQPSKDFTTFNNADLDFIQHTIQAQDPAAWTRIAPRLYRDHVN